MPWEAINDKRAKLVKMYCFEGKDFRSCAQELGYSNGTVARNEFYRSLTTLSKFATVRYYIEEHRDEISDVDHELLQLRYYKFMTVSEISGQLGLPIGTVRSRLFRFINKSKLKYVKYVSKNKVIPSSIF
jgi:sigma-70-like protein